MPLTRKMYRGIKVWAEVDDQGRLVAERGHVRLRFQAEDTRTYSVRAEEVEEIDEARLRRRRHGAAAAAAGKTAPDAARKGTAPRPGRRRAREGAARPAGAAGDDAILVFTDGACYGNPGPMGIGVLLEWRGRTREISRFLGDGTNNIAELTAIREGLRAIRQRRHPVRLYTDSAYALGVLTLGWKAKENRALVAEVKALMTEFPDLTLHKVRGHAGDPRNERADRLARDGIDRRGAP